MKWYIDCLGFKAPEHAVQFMSQILSDLQHMSPYDSYVDANVKKEGDDYLVTISIRHAAGKFSARSMSPDLKAAVNETADGIVLQMKGWRKSRFADWA